VTRRNLLAGGAAALLTAAGRLSAAKTHLTKARVSAITDELGRTQADAVDFAKKHGLQLVELRTVPELKKEFAFLTEPELKRYASELASAKIKVSLLKTSLLKFRWQDDEKRFARRADDFASAISAAQILGTDRIRIFTGARGSMALPAVARTLEEMIPAADRARVRLVIENESTQNVGTSAELKALLDLLPSKAIAANWDPWNAMSLGENAWPDGYKALPKDRILNVQIKAESLGAPDKIRWRPVLETLERDGFSGTLSLATEATGDAFMDKADDAVSEIMHIVGLL
jgi:sugar phosphate isomerase/epimerase